MSIFTSRQNVKIPQSEHDLSHTFSGSFPVGMIIPTFALKVVPGDVFSICSTPDLRSQPMISPIFTNVRVDIRYFYCRNLLLWSNFDQYITNAPRNNQNPPSSWVPPVHPYLDKFTGARGSLFDYLYGASDPNTTYDGIDALPARMYNWVYNEYYRNEFLSNGASTRVNNDGADPVATYTLRNGCYRKDYFTTAMPFTQAGNPVSLQSRVVLDRNYQAQHWVDAVGNLVTAGSAKFVNVGADTQMETSATPGFPANMDPNDSLGVSIDIRDLRNANAVQRFLERSAVNGNRYAEYMLAHFGIRTPDRSQFRPQYLGGGETFVNVSPVEQNAPTSGSPLATLGGRGRVSGIVGMRKPFLFTEYGWIMGLMVIRPDAEYVGGINRQYQIRGDRLDNYYNPAFQNVGMDEIQMSEIAYPAQSATYTPGDVFGYQERNLYYKTIPNSVHGDLLSSQNYWVVVRNFAGQTSKVSLNNAFVSVDTNALNANMAVSGVHPFVGSIRHNIIARRPMQYRANYKF